MVVTRCLAMAEEAESAEIFPVSIPFDPVDVVSLEEPMVLWGGKVNPALFTDPSY